MKRRLSAVLLALGLTVSSLSMGVYAEETETAATELVTEAVTEAEEAATETETAAAETAAAMSIEDQIKVILASNLEQLSAMTDEQLDAMLASGDLSSEAIATNWNSVKSELGAFVEVTEASMNAEGTEIVGTAKYEKIEDNTIVTVTYSVNAETGTANIKWDIDYPMSVLLKQAGLNTLMGLVIVFATLIFLAFLISKLHYIPDFIEGRMKKKAAPAPAAAPAAAPAPVVEEEEYVDDLELVAVITAAIAASENTSSDGFVVRSIKKANKKNWQRA